MARKFSEYPRSTRGRVAIALAVVVCIIAWQFWPCSDDEKSVGVLLTGVHHMGDKFYISRFYVDGYSGGNVGHEGGGGSNVCCVTLPYRWTPELAVNLRWEVDRWGDDPAIPEYQVYHARVPVEKYESAEHLYVHFYAEGRVRVLSSFVGSGHPDHPAGGDTRSAERATKGKVVSALFTKEELDKMNRDDDSRPRWQ